MGLGRKRCECSKCGFIWTNKNPTIRPRKCTNGNCQYPLWDIWGFKKCESCERHFLKLHLHHLNGNNKDNKYTNLMWLCEDCHSAVHNGLKTKDRISANGNTAKSRTRKYKNCPEIAEYLLNLREYWIFSSRKKK